MSGIDASRLKASVNFLKTVIDDYTSNYATTHRVEKGYAFVRWYLDTILDFDSQCIEKVLTDGYDDQNIDTIYFEEQDHLVYVYQFKNPQINRFISQNDVSGFVAGIREIRKYLREPIPNNEDRFNEKLRNQLQVIKSEIRAGNVYGFHLKLVVGSNVKIEQNLERLKDFVEEWRLDAVNVQYSVETLEDILNVFRHRIFGKPVEELKFDLRDTKIISQNELRVITGVAKAKDLADAYLTHREQLLMKNVRVFISDSTINDEIYQTCTGDEAPHFLYYNNGITFVTDRAQSTPGLFFMHNPQIVNGGQTIRMLAKALENGTLRDDEVFIQIRVIETGERPELATRISVALNTQNKIESEDIIFADEIILLLTKALEGHGLYLERRLGELEQFSEEHRQEIAKIINKPPNELENHSIPLKPAIQYYVATKGNRAMMMKREYSKFLKESTDELNILFEDLTPEEFVLIYKICIASEEILNERNKLGRRTASWQEEYEQLLVEYPNKDSRALIRNLSMILQGIIYDFYVRNLEVELHTLLSALQDPSTSTIIILDVIETILKFVTENPDAYDATWATLMKRRSFYQEFITWAKNGWVMPSELSNIFDTT